MDTVTTPEPGDAVFTHAPDAVSVHLWREVILTYRQMMRSLAGASEFTGAQFEVLRQLAIAAGGRSTVSALSRELAVDPAAVTRLVARLTELGLVEREADARDGRRRPVLLTGEGRRRMGALHAALHKREAVMTQNLDPQDIAATIRVLASMRLAADALSRRP